MDNCAAVLGTLCLRITQAFHTLVLLRFERSHVSEDPVAEENNTALRSNPCCCTHVK